MKDPTPVQGPQAGRKRAIPVARFLAVGFALLTIGLVWKSGPAPVPLAPQATVDPSALKPGPRRAAMADPPSIRVGDTAQNCNACHQIFKSSSPANTGSSFHANVVLRHGMNNRCTNCHDADDREKLTLRDGARVPFLETPTLCAQCHGTVFRDWQRGTHGKTMGSWRTGSSEQHRLTCNQCHDPHSPRYDSYQPLPGPNTLRMGPQETKGRLEGKKSPLQRWLTQPGPEASIAPPTAPSAGMNGDHP